MNPASAPSSSSPVDRYESGARRGVTEGGSDELACFKNGSVKSDGGGPSIDIFENMARAARAAAAAPGGGNVKSDSGPKVDVFENMARAARVAGLNTSRRGVSTSAAPVLAADDIFERMARTAKTAGMGTSKHGPSPTHAHPTSPTTHYAADDDLEGSVHGAIHKADADGRTANLTTSPTYGLPSPPSGHHVNDLDRSSHDTMNKSNAAGRAAMHRRVQSANDFGGHDRWDKLVRISNADCQGGDPLTSSRHGAAGKGSGEIVDRLDALARLARGKTGSSDGGGGDYDLESSCHGSVSKANPSARKSMLSLSATTGGGTGRFASLRRDGDASTNALGRSLNGRAFALARAQSQESDDLGSSTHGAIAKADTGGRQVAFGPRKASPSPRQVPFPPSFLQTTPPVPIHPSTHPHPHLSPSLFFF